MKILLVSSMSDKADDLTIPLGISLLATILKNAKYDVEILDFEQLYKSGEIDCSINNVERNIENLFAYIKKIEFDIIGFYNTVSGFHINILLAEEAKKNIGKVSVIFFGAQASVTAKDLMEQYYNIDVVAKGESELIIVELVSYIRSKKSLHTIPNILFRQGNDIISTENRETQLDFNDLPMIADEFIDKYKELIDRMPIEVSRGCPFECIYCSTCSFGKRKGRMKSIDKVISEIIYHYQKGYRKFSLLNDLFTFNRDVLEEFCNRIIGLGMCIEWSYSSRLEQLDTELIILLKESGCDEIIIGIETGSNRLQKVIRTNLNLSYSKIVLKTLIKNNINPKLSYIYGFRDENDDDLNHTLKMIVSNLKDGCKTIKLNLLTVFNGTMLYNELLEQIYFHETYSNISSHLSIQQALKMISEQKVLFPHFYDFHAYTRDNYPNLGIFVVGIMIPLYEYFSYTFDVLLDYFNGNVLDFYKSFKSFKIDTTQSVMNNYHYMNSTDNSYNKMVMQIKLLTKYIRVMNFGINERRIQEVFDFDLRIFYFQTHDDKWTEIGYYYDVFTARKYKFRLCMIPLLKIKVILKKRDGIITISRKRQLKKSISRFKKS